MIRRRGQLHNVHKDNRGFTLVEMIIAFAILAVVILMVSVIIQTGGGTYRTITTDINLQYESQLAMNQLQENVIDCNAFLSVGSDGTLYVFNKTGTQTYQAYQFRRDSGVLYLNSKTINTDDISGEPGLFDFDVTKREPMAEYIVGFTAEALCETDPDDADLRHVQSVRLRLSLKAGGAEWQGEQIIAPRNTVILLEGAP